MPFGGGTRRCLGASFATFEMRVVIRRVLERDAARRGRPAARSGVRKGVTIVPRRGVRVMQTAPPREAVAEPGERLSPAAR